MLLTLHGIGVSRGCTSGRALILQRDQPEVTEYALPDALLEDEVQRFLNAIERARLQLQAIRDRLPLEQGSEEELGAFIDTHLLMLQDSSLTEVPIQLIRQQRCNAEWALKLQRDRVVQVFEEMDDPYLRARKDDIDHVVRRVQRILLSEDECPSEVWGHRLEGRIVIADDLTPADTILMQHQGVSAFITEYGGPLSHTAILARSLGIPAIVGVRHARRYLLDDEPLIVDGQHGVILAGQDSKVRQHYLSRQTQEAHDREALQALKGQPALTTDGTPIALYGNIELPEDVESVCAVAADGIGLYRTEFLFMNRSTTPDEEEHLASYLHVIKALKGRPITIRTADLGADKQVDGGRSGPVATNPALGLRAVRLCLKDLDLFRPQLRAILRASAYGPVRMMIPMLSSLYEVQQVLRLVEEARRQLRQRGQAFDENLPIGGMIEVPAAAVSAQLFARQLDFLSIGTNDLIQYTLAIDRVDDEVNYLYDPLHPAVLSLIYQTIQAGERADIPVSMCGEMAGDPRYTRLLLGLGLTHFSMHPNNLLAVKQVIQRSSRAELQAQVRKLIRSTDVQRIQNLLSELVDY